jgi:endonuclease/exonuclease/phosphatase (EEP) superfamily protein YafD
VRRARGRGLPSVGASRYTGGVWRRILLVLGVLVVALLAASYLGVVHGLGDSLAVVRPALAGVAVVIGGLLCFVQRRGAGLVVGAAGLIAGLPVLGSSLPAGTDGDYGYSTYQKNLSFRLADPAPLIADIAGHAPDFVTLQEVTARTRAVMAGLTEALPSQHLCPFAAVGGVAVLSRWPKIAGTERCAEDDGLAAMQVETPDGPVWIVSIHLHWPFPYRQPAQLARLVPVLESLAGPIVIGGDFNMVPWSYTLGRVAQATDSERAGSVTYTLPMMDGWVTLPIDHVLVPRGRGPTSARRMALLGSDHHGVLAGFALAR